MPHVTKHIALLITGFGRGGAERQLLNLAKYLKSKGYKVCIFSVIERNMFQEELEQEQIFFQQGYFVRGRFSLLGFRRLVRDIRIFKADMLITFMFVANIIGRVTRLFLPGLKLLTSVRNEKVGGSSRDKLFQFTNFLDEVTITNSRGVGDRLVARGIIDKRKLRVIPNGYDFELMKKEASTRVTTDTGIFHWLAVGNFRPQKNYQLLFKALANLKENLGSVFHIRIAGNLYDQKWPEDMLKDFNLQKEVTLIGIVTNIYEEYAHADGFVMTSSWEGLPNSMIEAMSFGIPVVGTDVGGISELIDSEQNGFLINSDDLSALTERMSQMMEIPRERRLMMGELARNKVNLTYNYEKVMKEWELVIEERFS